MTPTNRAASTPTPIHPIHNPWRWVWVSVAMSILLCIVIIVLHAQRHKTLDQMAANLEALRESRIELSDGFLQIMDPHDPAAPAQSPAR